MLTLNNNKTFIKDINNKNYFLVLNNPSVIINITIFFCVSVMINKQILLPACGMKICYFLSIKVNKPFAFFLFIHFNRFLCIDLVIEHKAITVNFLIESMKRM